ncbi:sugar ABC transporter ATP-binding protein [Clostridium sp.]|uniref:sugar ABC transporter ATP-binding protein n=1 Tax=Clostridium sp. TaxID=1506 RepID=UPI001A515B84|nr:sugar ABC transporter ATP-binding protein [Clostridium sp.]MBK5237017.1 sugar ABC transporter ATP-binding protein [Clostridium sp.]
MQNSQTLLSVKGLTKYFPGIKALDEVEFNLRSGEVHAMIGENGAGKSTLVKIITGVYTPTKGSIIFDGKPIDFKNALDAQNAGIAAIHQEASMFDELSVVENIYMGHHETIGKAKKINWKGMREKTKVLLEKMQLDINPDTLVKNLSVAQCHMVEIAKALSFNAKLVIMDEPTSALTSNEVKDLFRIVTDLKNQGKAILFISHKFEEIFEICDSYTVLRDGKYIGDGKIADASEDTIINMMIGRSISSMYPKRDPHFGKVFLEVNNLGQLGAFKDVSFKVHEGEILGFFGLVGAGRSEVVRTIFGIDEKNSGTMKIEGKDFNPKNPQDAINSGITLVPEDRQRQGLILEQSISRNIALPNLSKLSTKGFILNKKLEKEYVDKYGKELEIKAANYNVDAQTLSGGNQQKVVLAKWIGMQPKLLILDEPTKGIDVATKAAVHQFMAEMANVGKAIIIISSELPEVQGMADNIVVMHEGVVTGILNKEKATSERIMRYAIGGGSND